MSPLILIFFLTFQWVFYDHYSLAAEVQPYVHRYQIKRPLDNNLNVTSHQNGSINDGLAFDRQITVDQYGVQRSPVPFETFPRLYHDVLVGMYTQNSQQDPKVGSETILRTYDFKGTYGPLLESAWNITLAGTDPVGIPLQSQHRADVVKVAAHVYSMEHYYNGMRLYSTFNDVTARQQAAGCSYENYPFKGLYGLLMQNLQVYTIELYRGIRGSPMEAEVGQYMRFNRYMSASTIKQVAYGFTGGEGGGTLMIIKGKMLANYIQPYSQFPGEEEYLISPGEFFRVVAVDKTVTPRIVTLESQKYSFQP